jgi:hypothetical protein
MSQKATSTLKKKYKGQGNFGESKTVPDQSMSLRELLIRYAKGLPLEGQKTPIWEGEEGFDVDPQKLDLAEVEELREKAEQELKDINNRVKQEVEKKRAKKRTTITEIKDENQTEN